MVQDAGWGAPERAQVALMVYSSQTKSLGKITNDKESSEKVGKGFEQATHRRSSSGSNRQGIDKHIDLDRGLD